MDFFFSAILLGLSVAVPMGPVNLEIMRRGLAGGFAPAFLVGLGASTVDGAYCILFTLAFGLGAAAPETRQWMAVAGGIILTLIGLNILWGALRDPVVALPSGAISPAPATRRALHGYLAGLIMTAVNPMNLAFWASIGAAAGLHRLAGMGDRLLFAGGVMLGALLWVFTFSTFLHHTRHRVSERFRRGATAAGGLGIVFFGVRMLFAS